MSNPRENLRKTTAKWQEELSYRGFEEPDRRSQMNANYKAHLEGTASQIRTNRNIKIDEDVRDHLTEEELNRENRLESTQLEEIADSYNHKETKKTLDKVRKNKSSWW